MMRAVKITTSCALLTAVAWSVRGQSGNRPVAPESLVAFVQGFYDWYVPLALGDHEGPASNFVLGKRRSSLSDELVRALEADSRAQEQAEAIVGLDFDPFLAAQDPCEHYEVGRVTQKAQRYWVDIYGVCSGQKHERADVVAELVQKHARWVFVNFYYPRERTDLLTELRRLRKARNH